MSPKNFTVRLLDDQASLIEQIASDRGATSADVLRDAVTLYVSGTASKLKGADEGYLAGRAFASQLAFELLREAQEKAPKTYEEATVWMAKRKAAKLRR